MASTLNDKIEDLFRGVVFVLFDFIRTALTLFFMPITGYTFLIKRLHNPKVNQIRPYVFLFLAIYLCQVFPGILERINPREHPVVFRPRVDGEGLGPSAVTRFYK